MELRDIATAQLGEVRDKLAELLALESSLSRFVDSCESACAGGAVVDCTVLDDLAHTDRGSRARMLWKAEGLGPMNKRAFLGAAFALWASKIASAFAAAAVGKPAPAFSVIDAIGRPRTLVEFKGKPIVLEWSSSSCPYAKAQYVSERMQELQKWSTENGIVWLTIPSGVKAQPHTEPKAEDAICKPLAAGSVRQSRGPLFAAQRQDNDGSQRVGLVLFAWLSRPSSDVVSPAK